MWALQHRCVRNKKSSFPIFCSLNNLLKSAVTFIPVVSYRCLYFMLCSFAPELVVSCIMYSLKQCIVHAPARHE